MAASTLSTVLQHIRRIVSHPSGESLTDIQLLDEFRANKNQTAFAVLVKRHGPMVWGVCHHVLQHHQDEEDAFQATFLVLARKAASIRKKKALASWLHGVAYRMAMNAKRSAARRRIHEEQAKTTRRQDAAWELGWREVQAVIDEEIEGLPEKYRAVFIVCCLEGIGRAEAGCQLGLKEGTVSSRLDQARKLLQRRLARRGVTLSSVLGAIAVSQNAATAVVSPALVNGTVRAAPFFAACKATSAISANVARLAEGAMKTMFASKMKSAIALMLAVSLVTGAGALAHQALRANSSNAKPEHEQQPVALRIDGADKDRPIPDQISRQDGGEKASGQGIDNKGSPVAGAKKEPLRGTVYAADGSPAVGAIVWAAKLYEHGPLVRQETTADAKGNYALNLVPGSWNVWARRGSQGGEGPALHEPVEIAAGRAPQPVPIYLEDRGTFRGRLLQAETGKPISGGRLFLDAGLVLTTDAEGRFQVGGLYRGEHESYVVAPGRMRMRVLFDTTARAETELDVPVPRAGKIVGRVTDMEGKPIKGAYVGRHTSGSYFSINGLFLACDADGRFEYDDAVPPDQPTRLAAGAPSYDEAERDPLKVSPDGTPLELHFRLSPTYGTAKAKTKLADEEKRRTISGIVRGPDEKPVAGVLVRWGYQPYVGAIETRTDATGHYRLTVPDKADLLTVLPRDFLPEFLPATAGGDQTFEVALSAGNTAAGRVVDDTGKPIKDVRVIAIIPSPDPRIGNPYWLSESAGRTNAEGKFELRGVPPAARFDFLKPGLSEVRNHVLELGGADNTVTLLYGGAISGHLVGRNGKPIRNFRVLVSFPRESKPGDQTSSYFAGFSGIGVRFTSPDGSFVLTGVGAGSVYRITALADGHGEAVADRVTAVPVNRLGTAKAVTLRAGPPVALRLRAVKADGQPIAGARVTLVNGEPGLDQSFSWGYHDASWEDMIRSRTGADGWADFPALSFADATVLVQAPGYGRHRFGWRDKQKELTVQLAPEAVVAGEVRDPAGKLMKAFYVNLMSGGDQISATVGPDDKGRFRLTELPAGTWSVTIRDINGVSTLHQSQVSLEPGETKDLKIKAKKE
jgi:RNA polymerase sigma factor (sigma-70 family)